ncbi:hypothetical protein A3D11_01150 [Candidatus Peribacteria bacterium RIFCSPHIGHO2_02_FULL_49_16]|nr:MAG: hypothetical protein A2880_02880 [Candidatus Peribacteria bacterium RIFCSPHIGHO2_01_FULL_49_38]OGJ58728.1 MAG: hypothetical protein A3D11_01150 [Candidatus Peribacteria bacterium RIFCSPHIGHO2_02_FULL_49_16]
MENFGYALWLEPAEPKRTELRQLIMTLSEQMSGPLFAPHCTVLAHIEGNLLDIRRRVRELVSGAESFPLMLLHAELRKQWNRCLYLRVGISEELFMLNERAQKLFEKQEEFLPHISVLYGEFPEHEKERLIKDAGFNLPCEIQMNTLSLNNLHSSNVEDWKIIERYSLHMTSY